MYPKWHILLGAIFSLLIWIIFPSLSLLYILLIFCSSVLIDIDHYLFYWIKKKTLNLREAYKWFVDTGEKYDNLPKKQKKKYHLGLMVFHSIEFLIIVLIFSFFYQFLFFIFLGLAFHILTDLFYEIFDRKRAINKISLIYTLLTKKFIGMDFCRFNRLTPIP